MEGAAPKVIDIEAVRRLADANGVSTQFWDWYGARRDVSARSLLRVLEALGVPVDEESTEAQIEAALIDTEDEHWRGTLPDCLVVREGDPQEFPVHVPHGDWVKVEVELEDGASVALDQVDRWVPPRVVDGAKVGRATFRVPGWLPLGWHALRATCQGDRIVRAPLAVVPRRLDPPVLREDRRRWGVAAQVYSVRSSGSWGIGDAMDLSDLAAVCAEQGADFLLINPMHAASPVPPMENSPYLPVTRRWTDPIYIRPEAIDEYAGLGEAERGRIAALRERSRLDAGGSGFIDRGRAWGAKREALELLFAARRSVHREAELRAFVRAGGQELTDFARWCALVERTGAIEAVAPREDAGGQGVADCDLCPRAAFWAWCQWIVGLQIGSVQETARRTGMEIGLMADLAVGVHRSGSETWAEPMMFALGMTVGAPPDMYSQQGQNWSQPPWSPRALARSGYRPLREMIRATLAHAGAVRIDHIMGLFRLWWIPEGEPASHGTYVRFDHEAMVGVLLLEAQRAGALVVGEDLGTVEPWVRDYLADRGILGTSILWFEKDSAGWPLRPQGYRRSALATVTTHDLPPTAGYLEGVQTKLRDELGLLVDDVDTVREADRVERDRMLALLRDEGLLEGDRDEAEEAVTDSDERAIVEALHRHIAATSSQLVGAALVDAVGDKRPQNLPGTDREYPNWCVPLCDGDGNEVGVEGVASSERAAALFEILRETVR